MDPYTNNGGTGAGTGADAQQPPPYVDPNPTRYIPAQDAPRPDVPSGAAYPPQGQPGASQQSSYAPPANGAPPSYQYLTQNTTPYAVNPPQRRDRDRSLLAIILIGAGVL